MLWFEAAATGCSDESNKWNNIQRKEQRTYIEDDSSHVKIENGTYQKERNPLLAVIFP